MPAGLIEQHGDVLVVIDRRREAIEEQLHRLGVHVGQDQREGIVGSRLYCHCREDIGEREALIGYPTRALASLPPDMAGTALLADPRLVLEEDADTPFVRLRIY